LRNLEQIEAILEQKKILKNVTYPKMIFQICVMVMLFLFVMDAPMENQENASTKFSI